MRLEYAAENWADAVEAARGSGSDAAVERHPVSNPTDGEVEEPIEDVHETRRGAQTIQQKEASKFRPEHVRRKNNMIPKCVTRKRRT